MRLARHFKTRTVHVVGSQAILLKHPYAVEAIRQTTEFDLYPSNWREFEEKVGVPASEETSGLFGSFSPYAHTYGYFIDGVDPATAKLPIDWHDRQLTRKVMDNTTMVRIIGPSVEDLVVSKLAALRDKDKDYVRSCVAHSYVDVPRVLSLINRAPIHPAKTIAATRFMEAFLEPAARPAERAVEAAVTAFRAALSDKERYRALEAVRAGVRGEPSLARLPLRDLWPYAVARDAAMRAEAHMKDPRQDQEHARAALSAAQQATALALNDLPATEVVNRSFALLEMIAPIGAPVVERYAVYLDDLLINAQAHLYRCLHPEFDWNAALWGEDPEIVETPALEREDDQGPAM